MFVYSTSNTDRVLQYLIVIFAFIFPLTVFGGNLLALLILTLWLLSGNYKEKFQRIFESKLAISSFLFFLVFLTSVLWSEDKYQGLSLAKKMIDFALLLPILITTMHRENLSIYINAFLASIILSIFFSFLIFFGLIDSVSTTSLTSQDNPTPFMSHVSYTPFLAISFYLIFNRFLYINNKNTLALSFYAILLLLITFNIFITGGRAGHIAFFALFTIALFQKYKFSLKAIFSSLIFILLISSLAFSFSDIFKNRFNESISFFTDAESRNNTSTGLRITYWSNTLEMFSNNLLFGVGIGDFNREYRNINEINSPNIYPTTNPHNMYLFVASTTGLVGIISLLSMFYLIYKDSKKYDILLRNKIIGVLLFFLLICFFESYLLGHYTSFLFIFLVSTICSREWKKK